MTADTVAEVARGALSGERFDLALRTFLDRFRADPLESRLKEEPEPLAGRLPDGAGLWRG